MVIELLLHTQASKDLSAYQAQRKKVEHDHKELTNEVTTMQSQLKSENADNIAEKLSEIQVCTCSSIQFSLGILSEYINFL